MARQRTGDQKLGGTQKFVRVPLDLLQRVLDQFELETFGDDYASEQMQEEAKRMRREIAELRRIAGIDRGRTEG